MAGWLAGFRSPTADAAAAPQPFELVCECDVRHSGLRRKTSQRIICRTCGAALFVLPRDVYPVPAPPKAPKKKPKPRPDDEFTADVGEEAAAPGSLQEIRPRPSSRHRRKREGLTSRPPKPAGKRASETFASVVGSARRSTVVAAGAVGQSLKNGAVGFWRWWTPLRITALAILLLMIATGMWTIYARRIDRAETALNPAVEEGLQALVEGKLTDAQDQLAIAVDALRVLDRDSPSARGIRQTHSEVRALNSLASRSLLDILDEAEQAVAEAATVRKGRKPDPEDEPPPPLDHKWVTRFETFYQNRWLVMEAPVRRAEAEAEDERPLAYVADFPIGVGPSQRLVEVQVDFPAFESLEVTEQSRMAVFGGRLVSCRLSPDEERWIVKLDPNTGFLWTGMETYRRLGFVFRDWRPQDEVERLLAAQAKAMDVELPELPEPSNQRTTVQP